MIAAIRITGQVNLKKPIKETLHRLRLRRKYSCVILNESKVPQIKAVEKLRDFIAFGEIDDKTFEKLIQERGQPIDKKEKIDAKKIIEELKKGKKYEDLGLKPFFRLHPARGGIETKKHYPKGVLGNQKKDINKLIERML
jgi:large subunit ribosomal protein L30